MLHAIIMAGGSGTRFWPASRRLRPKQLLALAGDQTMLQGTLSRLGDVVPSQRQMILTNRDLVSAVSEQVPSLPPENIVGEPCKRDTAPCIGLAAAIVQQRDPEAIMAVMPSDHVIQSDDQFQTGLLAAEELVKADPSRIVTFGIRPNYPAESFGYIQRGGSIAASGSIAAFKVESFREKPDRKTAQEYLDSGTYYWNSGIFVWKASTILEALKSNVPEMYDHLACIAESLGTDLYPQVLEERFTAIEGKSIDYAVMEGYPNVVTIEAPFHWDDLGSWQSLSRLHAPDENQNTVVGSHLGIDSQGCIIVSESDHTIATIDVEDLIVVQTRDATLVAPKHAEERVREIVKKLGDQKLTDLL